MGNSIRWQNTNTLDCGRLSFIKENLMLEKFLYLYNVIKRSFSNYIFFTFYILYRPNLLRLFFDGIYVPQYLQYEWMKKFQINTFIDIGANDGNVSKAINYISPKTIIYAFDPIRKKKDLILSKIKSSNLIVEDLALSDHIGSQDFYEYNHSPSSSFLKPNPKVFMKSIKIAKCYPVKITTLDRYFDKKRIKKPIFIKMDAEGVEDLIIRGGEKLLKKSSLVVIEIAFIESRKNQSTFDNIYGEMDKLGYIYKGSIFDSHFYPKFGPKIYENSLFIKKRELSNYLEM